MPSCTSSSSALPVAIEYATYPRPMYRKSSRDSSAYRGTCRRSPCLCRSTDTRSSSFRPLFGQLRRHVDRPQPRSVIFGSRLASSRSASMISLQHSPHRQSLCTSLARLTLADRHRPNHHPPAPPAVPHRFRLFSGSFFPWLCHRRPCYPAILRLATANLPSGRRPSLPPRVPLHAVTILSPSRRF